MLCVSSNIFSPQVCPCWTVYFKGFYQSLCLFLFSQEESLFRLCWQGRVSPRATFCCSSVPTRESGVWWSQKEDLWDSMGGSGKDNVSRRFTLCCLSRTRHWKHPSSSYTHPSFYFLWMSGFWGPLLSEGPRASSWWFLWWFSAFLNRHVVTIRVGWWEPKAALKLCRKSDLNQREDLLLSLFTEKRETMKVLARPEAQQGACWDLGQELALEAESRHVGISFANTPGSAVSNMPWGHSWKLLWIPGIDAL